MLFLAVLVPAAATAGVGAEDLAEIREAIQRQTQVKSPDCPVYRPASLRFSDLVQMGADVVQEVHVTDRSGASWLAFYAMERRPDGRWHASGCRVLQPARKISA
ncbi:MAG: DUF4864 domain-containing protein [Betaproteobacteria bacterium]